MTKKNGLQISSDRWQHIFDWEGRRTSIKSCVNDKKIYKKSRLSLRDKQIMFVDQIYDKINGNILDWYLISKLANAPPRGRVPDWYKQIKQNLVNPKEGLLTPHMKTGWYTNILSDFNPKRSRKNLFVASIQARQGAIIFGKTISKKRSNGFMKIKARHMILVNQVKLV